MKSRLNRSLSSVKSLAPCYQALRTRHAKSYDFVCRACGTKLESEKMVVDVLGALCSAMEGSTEADFSVREFLVEYEAMRLKAWSLRSQVVDGAPARRVLAGEMRITALRRAPDQRVLPARLLARSSKQGEQSARAARALCRDFPRRRTRAEMSLPVIGQARSEARDLV